jgi:hypothetical protein
VQQLQDVVHRHVSQRRQPRRQQRQQQQRQMLLPTN